MSSSCRSVPCRPTLGLLALLLLCPGALAATCLPSATQLCLQDARFQVQVDWQDRSGRTGQGSAVQLTGDTGYFTFFNPQNVELVTKILDGRGVNGHFWVFYGALSNVHYTMTVIDTATGQSKVYDNPQGKLASASDPTAFGPFAAPVEAPDGTPASVNAASPITPLAEPLPESSPTCTPTATELCINHGRFRARATWRRPDGTVGMGQAVSLTRDTGYFWFFRSSNVELVVKAIDGRAVNGDFWVFSGSLTDVEYVLEVTDTTTGSVRVYQNPSKTQASLADTSAFTGMADPAAVAASLRSFADRIEATSHDSLVRQSPELAMLARGATRVIRERLECLAHAAELGSWVCRALDPETGVTSDQVVTAAEAGWLAAYLTLDPTFDGGGAAAAPLSLPISLPGSKSSSFLLATDLEPTLSEEVTSAPSPATSYPALPECGLSDRATATVFSLCRVAGSPLPQVTAAQWAADAICAAAGPRLAVACGAYASVSVVIGGLRAWFCNYVPIELNALYIEPRPEVELGFDDSRELVVRGIFRSNPLAANLVDLATTLVEQLLRRLGVPETIVWAIAASVASSWLEEAFGDSVPAPGDIARCEGTLSGRYARVEITSRTGGPVTIEGRTLRSGSSEAQGSLEPALERRSPWRLNILQLHDTPFVVRPTQCTGSGRYRLETYTIPAGPPPRIEGTTDVHWLLCDGTDWWVDTFYDPNGGDRWVLPSAVRTVSRCGGQWSDFHHRFTSPGCPGRFYQDCSLAWDTEVRFENGVLTQREMGYGSGIDPHWPPPTDGPLRFSQDTEAVSVLDVSTGLWRSSFDGTWFWQGVEPNCRVADVLYLFVYDHSGPLPGLGYSCRYVQSCP